MYGPLEVVPSTIRAAFRGGRGGAFAPLAGYLSPLRFIVWFWHIEFASPGTPEQPFCPTLEKNPKCSPDNSLWILYNKILVYAHHSSYIGYIPQLYFFSGGGGGGGGGGWRVGSSKACVSMRKHALTI